MRYYWLKFKEDFFDSKRIKKLRGMAGGDTYLVIYLKMQLKALKTGGILEFTGVEDEFADELALDLDENPNDVRVTLMFLLQYGLCECSDNVHYYLPWVAENTGSEGDSAKRVREHRQRKLQEVSVWADADVPYLNDSQNRTRYNGNYYVCMKRDGYHCSICGSTENLCMHHIDGYDPEKPENSDANKLLTLCHKCHSQVHAGKLIPEDVLERIGYYDPCNAPVTQVKRLCNVEIEKDKEIEKDNKRGRFTPPSLEEVKAYCEERGNSVDPQTFIDFYTAKDWMIGKNRMRDWKAAVRTWERNRTEKRKSNPALKYKQTPISETDFDKMIVNLEE